MRLLLFSLGILWPYLHPLPAQHLWCICAAIYPLKSKHLGPQKEIICPRAMQDFPLQLSEYNLFTCIPRPATLVSIFLAWVVFNSPNWLPECQNFKHRAFFLPLPLPLYTPSKISSWQNKPKAVVTALSMQSHSWFQLLVFRFPSPTHLYSTSPGVSKMTHIKKRCRGE